MVRSYFLAVIPFIFLFQGVALAETAQRSPIGLYAHFSLTYDDNVFAYSGRVKDAFNANLRSSFFLENNTKSLGDIISAPSFELCFRPSSHPYFPTFSSGLSGNFYGQNTTLNDRNYFIAVEQKIGSQTDFSLTYDVSFIEFIKQHFRTFGAGITTDFKNFQGNLYSSLTKEDESYGAGITAYIPTDNTETSVSYYFDLYLPEDSLLAYRSNRFLFKPTFFVTEAFFFNLYADIQKNKYINAVRNDMRLEWGLGMGYDLSEKILTQLDYTHVRFATDRVNTLVNHDYDKNTITIKVSLLL